MNQKPTVWAIIPAKLNSTRLPGKNLKDLCGKPMLAYILENAKSAKGIDRVIVTTDSTEVQAVAQRYGADVPFIRPLELSEDDVTSLQVLQNALDWFKEHEGTLPDYTLLLYPTSPLLKKERIEEAVALAHEKNSDSVISGFLDKGHYWNETEGSWERLYPKVLVNSQFSKPLFKENGAIYLTRTEILATQIVADRADVVIMDVGENVDVDYPADFEKVERILRERSTA